MPAPRGISYVVKAHKAARARFESTALARIPSWNTPAGRTKRPVSVREAQNAQVRALLATLPENERTLFLSEYRAEVKRRMRLVDAARKVYATHAHDLASSARGKSYRNAYIKLHADLREAVGVENALFFLREMENSGVLKPADHVTSKGSIPNIEAAAKLVHEHKATVLTYIGTMGLFREKEEIYADILPDLCRRLLAYVPREGGSFKQYLGMMVNHVIMDRVRREKGRKSRKERLAEERMAEEAIRGTTLDSPSQKKRKKIGRKRADTISLDQLMGAEGPETYRKGPGEDRKFEFVDHRGARRREIREWRKPIYTALKRLPEIQQAILLMYYTEGETFKEIGNTIGLSESRVCKIHDAALVRMRELLQGYFE